MTNFLEIPHDFVKTEPEIISEILTSKKRITFEQARNLGYHYADYDQEHEDVEWYALSYGSKLILLTVDYGDKECTTFIQNIDAEKLPKETTLLHVALLQLMQEIANSSQTVFKFEIHTNNQNMINWAKGEGKDIFEWQEEEIQDDHDSIRGIYKTKISPQVDRHTVLEAA